MAKIMRYSDLAFEDQLAEAARNYLKYLTESDAKLKDQLADVMLESRDDPEIDEILKLLAFVRREIREHYAKRKRF